MVFREQESCLRIVVAALQQSMKLWTSWTYFLSLLQHVLHYKVLDFYTRVACNRVAACQQRPCSNPSVRPVPEDYREIQDTSFGLVSMEHEGLKGTDKVFCEQAPHVHWQKVYFTRAQSNVETKNQTQMQRYLGSIKTQTMYISLTKKKNKKTRRGRWRQACEAFTHGSQKTLSRTCACRRATKRRKIQGVEVE